MNYLDENVKAKVSIAIIIALVFVAFFIANMKGPLEGVHWDVPIYLYQAKRFTDTHYIANYVHHAAEVVGQIRGHYPADEWFSESYWRFVRLGNIAILGVVVKLFGSTPTSITFATWLYTIFLVGGVAFCISSVLTLGRTTDSTRPWFAGTVISALLFILSDIYGYLAGNLVSEVVSIFLLGAAVLALIRSVNSSYLSLAILSGLLAFISYTVRVESVWTWLTFLFAYTVTRGGTGTQSVPWKHLLAAGLTALIAFVGYAVIFHPLVDPRNYLAFVGSLTTKQSGGVPGYQLLFVAGGLLWIGTFVCLRMIGKSNLVRLGLIWLALSALPWVPEILLGGPCQTRMLTLLIPPLFLLSSAGWALLLEQRKRRSLSVAALIALCLATISNPPAYAWIHNIPGAWRIQIARPYLVVPTYERLDYLPKEMATLSRTIFDTDKPTVLISGRDVPQEYLNLIRFFGPPYISNADLALVGDPTNRKSCDGQFVATSEPVIFCTGYATPTALNSDRLTKRLLVLRRMDTSKMPNTEQILKTHHFVLDQISP